MKFVNKKAQGERFFGTTPGRKYDEGSGGDLLKKFGFSLFINKLLSGFRRYCSSHVLRMLRGLDVSKCTSFEPLRL